MIKTKQKEPLFPRIDLNYLGLTDAETLELKALFIEYLSDPDKAKILFSKSEKFGLSYQDIYFLGLMINAEVFKQTNDPKDYYNPEAVLSFDPSLY